MTVSRARVIAPLSGCWSPVMSSSSVVLPAPLGPTIAIRRPALIIRPTSLKRCWAACPLDTAAMLTRLMGRGHGTRAAPILALGACAVRRSAALISNERPLRTVNHAFVLGLRR